MGQVPGFSGMMLAMALSESFLAKSGSGPAGIDANGTELIRTAPPRPPRLPASPIPALSTPSLPTPSPLPPNPLPPPSLPSRPSLPIPSPLPLRKANEHKVVIHLSTWTSAADDAAVQAWTSKTTAALQSAAREQGKLHPFLFLNDAGTDQDVFGGYAAEKRQQLQDISRRYDPARVLQRLKQGGFKIGE